MRARLPPGVHPKMGCLCLSIDAGYSMHGAIRHFAAMLPGAIGLSMS